MAREGPSKEVNPEARGEGRQEDGREEPWKPTGQDAGLQDEGWRCEGSPGGQAW